VRAIAEAREFDKVKKDMENSPEGKEEHMLGVYEITEDHRTEMPGIIPAVLGPVAGEYFDGELFETVPAKNEKQSAVIASYVIGHDGVFSVEGHGPEVVHRGNPADARALALVTALAGEAVVIGPGTLSAEPENRWAIAGGVSNIPALASDPKFLAEMDALAQYERGEREKVGKPITFVLTRSGEIPSNALSGLFADERYNAFVATTFRGAQTARKALAGKEDRVLVFGENEFDHEAFLSYTFAHGIKRLSVQGGKKMFAPFVQKGLVSELLLSVMDAPAQGPEEGVQGERLTLFPNGTIRPHRSAQMIVERKAKGITLRTYDMRAVTEL
jgi:hypothetical protein